jgi:predicted permease
MNDLRFAVRQLLKNPGFAVIAVLTLALGIGANTAIFGMINEQFLRPMRVKDPEELLGIVLIDRSGDYANQRIPYPIYRDYQEQNRVFSELLAYAPIFSPVQINENLRNVTVHLASANYFSALGVVPVKGRTFLPEDDQSPGRPLVAVISHAFWQNHFQADPAVVGTTFTVRPNYVEPMTCTIIGVAPPDFTGLDEKVPDLWLPAVLAEHFRKMLSVSFKLVGRVSPDVTREQARVALDLATHNIAIKHGGVPLPGYRSEGIFRSDLRTELRHAALGSWGAFKPRQVVKRATILALAIVGLVLLIACANVSNLLLARAVKRRKEIAIRLSLGATRWQLLRQTLTESMLLSLTGGVAGLLVANWINKALVAFKPANLDLVVQTALDHRVIGFTLLVSILAGLIFGTAPAWQATRCDLNPVLKNDAPSFGKHHRVQLRDVLVAGQMALCLLLLIGAGLCGRSFMGLLAENPGFSTRDVMVVPLHIKGYTDKSVGPFYQDLAQRLTALPGVRSASYTHFFPMLGGSQSLSVEEIEGYTAQKDEFITVDLSQVGPNYFETLGIPISQPADTVPQGDVAVVWVNESFARRYLPGQAPVGKRVGRVGINGVVRDSQVRNLTEKPRPHLYFQTAQPHFTSLVLMVRTSGDARTMMSAVRQELLRSNRDFDLTRMQTMRQVLARSLHQQQFLVAVLGGLALTATLLAALGIYGVMSYSVSQRTREIGIRMAIGAQRGNVLALVLRHGMLLTMAGTALGVLAAVATTRVLASVLYGVSPTDLPTFIVIVLVLAAVAFVACWLPARRASRVNPIEALRYE